ncbi:MAG: hypothetical protein ACOY45_10285 [Pseudomonadota bacterium]
MTDADLTDLFVATLIRTRGGTRARWRRVLGQVRVYDRATHPHCNWELAPRGSPADIAAVEALSDRLRGEHPLIDA